MLNEPHDETNQMSVRRVKTQINLENLTGVLGLRSVGNSGSKFFFLPRATEDDPGLLVMHSHILFFFLILTPVRRQSKT